MSLRQVNRWENSGSESLKADALFRAVDYLGASLEHIRYLVQQGATAADGERLAEQFLQGDLSPTETNDSDIVQVVELALALRGDRPRLAQLVGLGRRLVQERGAGKEKGA
jgi:hypothetical protein